MGVTAQQSLSELQDLWATALYYAKQSQAGRNSDPLHDSSTALWVSNLNTLSFDSPNEGYQVLNSNESWQTWAAKFEQTVTDLIGYRETFGFDGHSVNPAADDTLTLLGSGFPTGKLTDDPLQGWWLHTAMPKLNQMALDGVANWLIEPLKEGANAIGDALDVFSPVVIVIIVILVLVLAIRLT